MEAANIKAAGRDGLSVGYLFLYSFQVQTSFIRVNCLIIYDVKTNGFILIGVNRVRLIDFASV
jgi:hypothetical protein